MAEDTIRVRMRRFQEHPKVGILDAQAQLADLIHALWASAFPGPITPVKDFRFSQGFETANADIPLRVLITREPTSTAVFGINITCAVEVFRIPGISPEKSAQRLRMEVNNATTLLRKELSKVSQVEILEVVPRQDWLERFRGT